MGYWIIGIIWTIFSIGWFAMSLGRKNRMSTPIETVIDYILGLPVLIVCIIIGLIIHGPKESYEYHKKELFTKPIQKFKDRHKMTYSMYLDDIRSPKYAPLFGKWVICRNYEEAIKCFEKHGWPMFISFDHDLGDENEPTGYDFAKFLVDTDLDTDNKMPNGWKFHVHSANPVGKANIIGIFNSYFAFKGE